MLALASLLNETPEVAEGWRWHVLPVLDPDAARLNLWYENRLSLTNYHRGFYRPPLDEQPGFTFPVADGQPFDRPLPETWALMQLFDELYPELVLDLHNADLESRAWFVLNRRWAGLSDALRLLVAHVRLPLAETMNEYVGWETDGLGVFIEPPMSPHGPKVTAHGASLNGYLPAATLAITPEVPLWRTRISDAPLGGPGAALLKLAAKMDASVDALAGCLQAVAADLVITTPFEAGVRATLDHGRRLAVRQRGWRGEVTAHAYASELSSLHLVRLRAAGMLLRALDAHRVAGYETAALRAEAEALEGRFREWSDACAAELKPRPYPIARLVRVQVETALLAARYLDQTS